MEETMWTGAFELIHVDGGGARVAGRPGPAELYTLRAGDRDRTTLGLPVVFDFDGDGEAEIFLASRHWRHHGDNPTFAGVFSLRNGSIKAYPGVPPNPRALRDLDRDGRPDILYAPYRAVSPTCRGDLVETDGPLLVAHSKVDGTFSLDDEVARTQVERGCPEARNGLARPDPAWPVEICVRLGGGSAAEAERRLRAECSPPVMNGTAIDLARACGDSTVRTCVDFQVRLGHARRDPPAVFRPAPR